MDEAARYRHLAEQSRCLASGATTRATIDTLIEMAAEYERKADELEGQFQSAVGD